MNNRILLGMSGGTDSSVSAMLLQEAGYEVVGLTFRFWEPHTDNPHLADAQALARRLHIPHYAIDVRQLFRKQVIDYFIGEYMAGRTPVPCVKCNNQLKWKLLSQEAERLHIPHIATGHYARIGRYQSAHCIVKGADQTKDQSFFLWGLDQQTLSKAILPLGNMTKQEVRAYAARHGFHHVATKRDSIGVCFCPGDYHAFLRQEVDPSLIHQGTFIDEAGTTIGQHIGYPFYTVGQRRRLGVQRRHPLFVQSIHPDTHQITLAPLSGMYKTAFHIQEWRSIHPTVFLQPEPLTCRIRYRKQSTPCHVEPIDSNRALVRLLEPLESIAPGQSAVFYRGDCVVGGGIIQ